MVELSTLHYRDALNCDLKKANLIEISTSVGIRMDLYEGLYLIVNYKLTCRRYQYMYIYFFSLPPPPKKIIQSFQAEAKF